MIKLFPVLQKKKIWPANRYSEFGIKILKGFNPNSPGCNSGYESILSSGTLKGFNDSHIEPLPGFFVRRTFFPELHSGLFIVNHFVVYWFLRKPK